LIIRDALIIAGRHSRALAIQVDLKIVLEKVPDTFFLLSFRP
jgi:hypothetical protein